MPRESRTHREQRVQKIIQLLNKYYPHPQCALHFQTPFQLLVATILSAQCTDERVNQVTPVLFKKYPDAQSLSKASLSEIEKIIHSTGFYKAKARNIKKCCEVLVSDHGGELPQNIDEMVLLSGVGRKTANVVLGTAFGIASGVVVDTHVTRLSQRLGLSQAKNPIQIERELMDLIPQNLWIDFAHWLVLHGRQICKARKPQCQVCFLSEHCPSAKQ